jgi:hypothetical protein
MNKKKVLSLLIMIGIMVSLFAPSSAVAKSEPQVLNFAAYTCTKGYNLTEETLAGGGWIWHITNMQNENPVFQITDKGRTLYAVAKKFLNLDVTFDADGQLLSSVGLGYTTWKLVNGNGGWEGYGQTNFYPGQNDNLAETATYYGTGSLKGRVMTTVAYGGFSGEPPSDAEAVCAGHGSYVDYGSFTGTISEKKDK